MKAAFTILAILALVTPAAPVSARAIMVDVCGAPGLRIALPIRPQPQKGDRHECCKKGCHAANERKKRAAGDGGDLGDDDDCC